MEIQDAGVERNRICLVEANPGMLRVEDAYFGLRMGPLGSGNGAAAIVVTAIVAANDGWGIRSGFFVAVMSSTDAACVRGFGL